MSVRIRVLCVEDVEDDALLVLMKLQSCGFAVEHARVETAAELEAALRRATWDIVVSDYMLPGFSAPEALAVVRAHDPDLPFIIVSGTIDEEAAVASLTAGAVDFLSKSQLTRLAPAVRRELADVAVRRARRAAENALRASEERFRQMAENIGEVFWMSDPAKDEMLYVGPAYETIWGKSRSTIYTNPMEWAESILPEHRARVEAALPLQITGGYDEVYEIQRPDGTTRWIRDRAFPVADSEGRVYRVVGIAEDITRLKDAEAALRRTEDQFRQAQKMEAVGRLAGGIAHDFNNLLTVIQGYGTMTLERLAPDDPLRMFTQEICTAADRAATLTRQLLAFSRKQILQPEEIDVNAALVRTQGMLQRLIGEDVVVRTELGEDVGCVLADRSQLEQVLLNLVVNSRDAMPHGGSLVVATSVVAAVPGVPGLPAGRYVCLAVSDDGTGMDAATAARAFEPFFTTKETGKGTGLGLSTVYGIVEQSRGRVTIDSAPGRGTTVRVYLPRIEPRAPDSVVRVAAAVPLRGCESILIVEDEDAVRQLVRSALRAAGYRVHCARSADEAMHLLRDSTLAVDLVLTDVVMPGTSGPALVSAIGTLGRAVRVLYMSGYPGESIALQAGRDTQHAFVAKPFTQETLLRRVRDVLDAPPPSGPARPAMPDAPTQTARAADAGQGNVTA